MIISSGVGVRVGEAQLRLRRADPRVSVLRQGRGRQDEEERCYPEDERDVASGADADPHHSTAIQYSLLILFLFYCNTNNLKTC